jgi:putative ABC transport system permease protein
VKAGAAAVPIGIIALAIIAYLFLPVEFALLVTLFLFIVYVFYDARHNRMLLTMARRNIWRRPGTTALVLGGLMVGTAIISASFVVSDTLDNMLVREASRTLGDVDFSIAASGSGGFLYLNDSQLAPVVSQIGGIDHVVAARPLILQRAPIVDQASQLSSASVTILGLTPQVASEFGGFVDQNGSSFATGPAAGEIYLNTKAATDIDARTGDTIVLFLGSSALPLHLVQIVQTSQLGNFEGGSNAFINLSAAQAWTHHPGQDNVVFVSLGANDAGLPFASSVRDQINAILQPYSVTPGLKIQDDKLRAIDNSKENAKMFTSLFFVFGSFSIIAGVALVVNIFTMLGEERKSEMGVARAIGMSRTQLRRLFTYEGVIYAALAAGIGAFVGLGLAFGLISVASGVIQFNGVSLDQYFTFTPFALTASYAAGFGLTVVTVYLATRRISNMNVVRAVRNIPEPPVSSGDRRAFRMGLLLLLGGFVVLFFGIRREDLAPASTGLSMITLSLGLLLRRFIGDRLAWNIAGITTLIVWLPLPFGWRIFPYSGSIELFVVAGLFMVIGALLIVMFNSDQIIKFITTVLRVRSGYRAVLMTAISYPLKAKFRTGLSIFIFGLVIFTVTTLTMISGVLAVSIPNIVEETSGGFDVVAFSNPAAPITFDPWNHINTIGGVLEPGNVTNLISMPVARVAVNLTANPPGSAGPVYRNFTYNVYGFDSKLYDDPLYSPRLHYPLDSWDSARYPTESDAWAAVASNSSLAIIDGSLRSGGTSFGPPSGNSNAAAISIGDEVVMTAPGHAPQTVAVVGITKQSALNAFFMGRQAVNESFGAVNPMLFLISFSPGLNIDRQAILFEKEFVQYGVQTISIVTLANNIVSQINQIFTLFRAFLALGLVIGISGLGIITIRSIHERRLEIGMMRAIGYTKRMVVANFALESAFVSVLGILVGSLLGIVVGYELFQQALSGGQFIFVIDWTSITIVGAGAFAATLLSVVPAARGASKVAPAEVLRFE